MLISACSSVKLDFGFGVSGCWKQNDENVSMTFFKAPHTCGSNCDHCRFKRMTEQSTHATRKDPNLVTSLETVCQMSEFGSPKERCRSKKGTSTSQEEGFKCWELNWNLWKMWSVKHVMHLLMEAQLHLMMQPAVGGQTKDMKSQLVQQNSPQHCKRTKKWTCLLEPRLETGFTSCNAFWLLAFNLECQMNSKKSQNSTLGWHSWWLRGLDSPPTAKLSCFNHTWWRVACGQIFSRQLKHSHWDSLFNQLCLTCFNSLFKKIRMFWCKHHDIFVQLFHDCFDVKNSHVWAETKQMATWVSWILFLTSWFWSIFNGLNVFFSCKTSCKQERLNIVRCCYGSRTSRWGMNEWINHHHQSNLNLLLSVFPSVIAHSPLALALVLLLGQFFYFFLVLSSDSLIFILLHR